MSRGLDVVEHILQQHSPGLILFHIKNPDIPDSTFRHTSLYTPVSTVSPLLHSRDEIAQIRVCVLENPKENEKRRCTTDRTVFPLILNRRDYLPTYQPTYRSRFDRQQAKLFFLVPPCSPFGKPQIKHNNKLPL